MYHHDHISPCLHCHQRSYIRMVQHLIERCLILKMSRAECSKALARHARIMPVVTLTVWRGLVKENRDFFQAYFRALSPRPFHSRLMGISKYPPTRFRRRRLRRLKRKRLNKSSISAHKYTR